MKARARLQKRWLNCVHEDVNKMGNKNSLVSYKISARVVTWIDKENQ